MRLQPVVADTDFDFDGAGEFEGVDHGFGHEFAEPGFFRRLHIEDEFVVDLQEHAAFEARFCDEFVFTEVPGNFNVKKWKLLY